MLSSKRGFFSKNGQVTIFIIVGILLLALIGFGSYYYSSGTIQEIVVESDQALDLEKLKPPVKLQVEYCLEKSTSEAIYFVGLQGGYYDPSPQNQFQFQAFIPYYYYEKKVHVPELNIIEAELGKAIQVFLGPCLNDITDIFFFF